MMRRLLLPLLLLAAACGAGAPPDTGAAPLAEPARPLGLSAPEIDSLWADAERRFRAGDWSDAAVAFERFMLEAPVGDARRIRARFYVAETYFARDDQLQAVREFRRVSDETPNDPLAPDALVRAGDAYAALWRRPELDPSYGQTALSTYQEVINRYPGTPAAARAGAQVAELQEMFARKALKAAQFYLRYKAHDSAIIYLKDLLANYPRTSVAPEALLALIRSYRVLGYEEDVRETCGYLRRFHADTPGAAEACPAGADTAQG